MAESAVANLRRDRALEEVTARLCALGVEVILLKGAALRRERPELAGRFECDADLLVAPEHVARARQALAALGFRPQHEEEGAAEHDAHPFHLACQRDGAVLELHWDLDAASPAGFLERLWQRRRPLAPGVALLAPEHQLLFGCLHLSRHAFLAGLRWLADLRRLLPVDAEVRARFEAEARIWPRRAVYCPLWLLASLGVRETPPLLGDLTATPVDRQLLRPVLVHLLLAEPWLGLPSWRQETALRTWLFARGRPALAPLLARSAGDGLAARLRELAAPRGASDKKPAAAG